MGRGWGSVVAGRGRWPSARLSPNRFSPIRFSLGSKLHQIRLQNQLIVRKSAAYIVKSASFVRKRTLLQHLADFRRLSKEPSKIGEKLSDFSIQCHLVFGEFFDRPFWGKPTASVSVDNSTNLNWLLDPFTQILQNKKIVRLSKWYNEPSAVRLGHIVYMQLCLQK